MNICFIMDDWDKIDVDMDSTLRFIHESINRNHTVGVLNANKLGIRNSVVHGLVNIIQKDEKTYKNAVKFHAKVKFKEQMLPLSGFDSIFLRTDPPIDNIMLNFLDSVKHDTFILNDIDGLRKANNKLYPASFYDPNTGIIPKTHVSKNKDYLKDVINETDAKKFIIKPLNGYGGQGVIVIEKDAMQNINSLLDFYIHGKEESNYVILQEYIEGADKGDVRILLLNGEPIGALKRVPASGDIRSNLHAGGSIEKHVITEREKEICREIGPKLVADGLYFVGIDIINNKILEINVISPGGVPMISKLNRSMKIQQKVIDFIENVVSIKNSTINRKLAHRRKVEDIF